MMRWLKRVGVTVAAIELAWLVIVNGALYLPGTQKLVSSIRPDRLHARWDRAWSPYPGRFHLEGVFANGETRSHQWQIEVQEASGSISLLPLLERSVFVSDLDALDLDIRVRPRLRADRDYGDRISFFPDIEGRELTPAEPRPTERPRPWTARLAGTLRGVHDAWVMNTRAGLEGTAHATVTIESHGGPVSLEAQEVALGLGGLTVNGQSEVFQRGALTGSVGVDPVVFRDQDGLGLLAFLRIDARVDIEAASLGFLDVVLNDVAGVGLGGAGRIAGRLRFERGEVQRGTALSISGNALAFETFDLTIAGQASATLSRDDGPAERLLLACDFVDLAVTHDADPAPLLVGRNMNLEVAGSPFLLSAQRAAPERAATYEFESLTAPDLSRLQRYLPEQWPLTFHGGSGTLDGRVALASERAELALQLTSRGADLGLPSYRFKTDLDAAVVLDNPALNERATDISGTFLRLSNARVKRNAGPESAAWDASFRITEGQLDMFEPHRQEEVDLFAILTEVPMRELLGRSEGAVAFESKVSSLAWLSIFLGEDRPTRIDGGGDLSGVLRFAAGMPAAGTKLDVRSPALSVEFMDYLARGTGRAAVWISADGPRRGRRPDWSLNVALEEAAMRRRGEPRAGIDDVALTLTARVDDVGFETVPEGYRAEVSIRSARLADMAQFNRYLPEDAPLELLGGQADLSALVRLTDDGVGGWARLDSRSVKARLDNAEVDADLSAHINLAGGDPARMQFDITGSTLEIDNVRVLGERRAFDEQAWHAQLRLERALTTWDQPPRLDAEARLSMSDSRPFVALLGNAGWMPRLLDRAMTVEEITGSVRISLADRIMRVPHAYVTGERVEIGMKGTIGEGMNDGIVLLQLEPLAAVLKIRDGRKNVDVINARRKFASYRVDSQVR